MHISIKKVKLIISKINEEKYKTLVVDLEDNSIIWDSGELYYIYLNENIIDEKKIEDLINQMKKMPLWEILEVENGFRE